MPHLTLNIDMHDRTALVVGGGAVACRKVRSLLDSGADVTVVTICLNHDLAQMQTSGGVSVRIAPYETADLEGVFLAVAATNDREVNKKIASDARQRGILVAVADAPKSGNCTFPAILRRSDLEIAVSTGGRCPAFAVQVRDRIAGLIGAEYGAALTQLAAEREKLLTAGSSSTYNSKLVRSHAQRLMAELTDHKEVP